MTIKEGAVNRPVLLIGIDRHQRLRIQARQRLRLNAGITISFGRPVHILSGAEFTMEGVSTQVSIDGSGGTVSVSEYGEFFTAAIMILDTLDSFTMVINGNLPFFAMAWD
eukprot:CAMPEP_0118706624 /NCGR_PEP_ID=MMETSP0800-20121206/20671_1 /TAXON_ID=210618 ORGANISM="Striatella unipunctata, Strain CCMP2910" /NCGR_SAMPLE_ID=MMETSP0800 /ASSEMBLY_ACC=CAM_ASM_000638 /LENGTH=109 /DNA_ID=CAMNT_0006609199 /DNA_START=311 /DNA_END=640 /DNA_ORIENTATION=+